jgi:hypothetical protein
LIKRLINNFNHLNISIYTSVETSTGTRKCKFFAKTVILEPISAYAILTCCKKQSRAPWRWRIQTPKRIGVKKIISQQKNVRINYWLIKSGVTHGARCIQRQNGTTLSHVCCDKLLQRGTAQNISTRQHFSITLRPVVQRYHTFVTHITHNSILPFKFRVEDFCSSSPETSSSRLLLRPL